MAQTMVEGKFPVGTLDEIKELGMDPAKVGSCSLPGHGNTGCTWFANCRFRQWRDGIEGRKGPLNIGVEIILGSIDGGAMDQKEMPCFQYYESGLANRVVDAPTTGELIRVVAYEGDGKEINPRVTVRENPKDPNDKRMLETVAPHKIRAFVRPKDKYPIYARREVAREQVMDEVERQALASALAKNTPEVVGAGRKVKDGSA